MIASASSRYKLLGCTERESLYTPSGLSAFYKTEALEWARKRGNPNAAIPWFQTYKLKFSEMVSGDWGMGNLALKYLEGAMGSELEHDMMVIKDRICISFGLELQIEKKKQEVNYFAWKKLPGNLLSKKKQLEPEKHEPVSTEEITHLPTAETSQLPIEPSPSPPNIPNDSSTTASNETPIINNTDRPQQLSPKKDLLSSPIIKPTMDAPKSAPPSMNTSFFNSVFSRSGSTSLAPTSTSSDGEKPKPKIEKAPASERSWRFKWFQPKGKVADLGDENAAYYDKDLKRWIFPDTDLNEISKPLPPPPTQISSARNEDKSEDNDPLAALMAPPPAPVRGRKVGAARVSPGPPSPAKFTVFQPKAD